MNDLYSSAHLDERLCKILRRHQGQGNCFDDSDNVVLTDEKDALITDVTTMPGHFGR
jgi:hypothetical protein